MENDLRFGLVLGQLALLRNFCNSRIMIFVQELRKFLGTQAILLVSSGPTLVKPSSSFAKFLPRY